MHFRTQKNCLKTRYLSNATVQVKHEIQMNFDKKSEKNCGNTAESWIVNSKLKQR